MNFEIKGGVVEQGKRKGIRQVRVEACDVRGFVEDYIAYSLTDDDGSFVITLAQDMVRDMFPRDPLEVFFKVWCGSTGTSRPAQPCCMPMPTIRNSSR